MSVDDAGRKLLADVEEASLDESLLLLKRLHQIQSPPQVLPIPGLSALLPAPSAAPPAADTFAELLDALRTNPAESLLEVCSPAPCSGNTPFLTLLAAELLRQDGAVIYIDNDGRFDVPKLYNLLLRSLPDEEGSTKQSRDMIARSQLRNLAIFRPDSFASFLSALEPASIARLDLGRPVRALVVDSLPTFAWEARAASGSPGADFAAAIGRIHALAKRLGCLVVYTAVKSGGDGTSVAGARQLRVERVSRPARIPARVGYVEAWRSRDVPRSGSQFRVTTDLGRWSFEIAKDGEIKYENN